MATVIAGMAEVLSTYTESFTRSNDVQFAVDLAQSQLDEITYQSMTQTSLAFDTTGMGRTYLDEAANSTVTQYFFNNFPVLESEDNSTPSVELPWPDPVLNASWSAYFEETPFYHNRYYDIGGNRLDADGPDVYSSFANFASQMKVPGEAPHFVVRLQLFGVSWQDTGTSNQSDIDQYLSCADTYTNNGTVPTTPPSSCPQLIADTCANTTGTLPCGGYLGPGTGEMWINYNGESTGVSSPYYFDEYTSKILVAQVYRAADFLNYETFYDSSTNHLIQPLASASAVIQGTLVLR